MVKVCVFGRSTDLQIHVVVVSTRVNGIFISKGPMNESALSVMWIYSLLCFLSQSLSHRDPTSHPWMENVKVVIPPCFVKLYCKCI